MDPEQRMKIFQVSALGAFLLIAIILPIGTVANRLPPTWCLRPVFDEASYDGLIGDGIPHGRKLEMKCKEKYKDIKTFVTCLTTGNWSRPQPECQLVTCPFPSLPSFGNLNIGCRHFNCAATYSCPVGYTYTGDKVQICQRNETWSGVPGTCQAVLCPEMADPPHGKVLQTNRSYLAVATVECDEGYIHSTANMNRRQCLANNTWGGTNIACEAVRCLNLPGPQNGRVYQGNGSYLSNATTECDKGYVLRHPEFRIRQCQGNNKWSGQDTQCERISCREQNDVENGMLDSRKGSFKDRVTLQCQRGYILDGPSTITCTADGTWSAKLGVCRVHNAELQMISLPIFGGALLLVVIVVGYLVYRGKRNPTTDNPESIPLFTKKDTWQFHCSFSLSNDFGKEYTTIGSPEYLDFSSTIQKAVQTKLGQQIGMRVDVTVVLLCSINKTAFLDIYLEKSQSQDALSDALKDVNIVTGHGEYHVAFKSISYREEPVHRLVAAINRKMHVPDKILDKVIDFNRNYVKLKLLEIKEKGAMSPGDTARPDLYQRELDKIEGKDVEDKDLLSEDGFQNYIIFRGRAGIGKSTLLQRLCWKWANGQWATHLEVIFMLNVRYLITVENEMSLSRLLSLYAVYNTASADITFDEDWLLENEASIGFIFDGIDEIGGFKQHWSQDWTGEVSSDKYIPLAWCFALMKRAVLPTSTVIISSRPFADLSVFPETLTRVKLVELMGLTRDRVMEFVNKNTTEDRQVLVKRTLENNPLLLSVSSITFYCAALCQVLGSDTASTLLTTYTRITAYIMEMYILRSMGEEISSTEAKDKVAETLRVLSKLASTAFLEPGRGGLPRLVFDRKEMDNMLDAESRGQDIAKHGLLVETSITDPEQQSETKVLIQFVHLSIQEYLAMAGLLEEDPTKVKSKLEQVSHTDQFNMTLLFLFGLAFDGRVGSLTSAILSTPSQNMQKMLLDNIGVVSNNLQALQIAHESQSKDVAEKLGQERFQEEVCIKGTKLTALDVVAITFMLEHHPTVRSIRLSHIGIDLASLREFTRFLKDSHTITTFELKDRNLDDKCLAELMTAMKRNKSIKELVLSSPSVTDKGLSDMADLLKANTQLKTLSVTFGGVSGEALQVVATGLLANTTLQDLSYESPEVSATSVLALAGYLNHNTLKNLSLSCAEISDAGMNAITDAIKTGTELISLRLFCDTISDQAVENLTAALTAASSLKKLEMQGFYMMDAGAKAVLNAVEVNRHLSVGMWTPDCNEQLFDLLDKHVQVSCGDKDCFTRTLNRQGL